MTYRHLTGPAFDEDCQCHCMDERNQFQGALDEIELLLREAFIGERGVLLRPETYAAILKELELR